MGNTDLVVFNVNLGLCRVLASKWYITPTRFVIERNVGAFGTREHYSPYFKEKNKGTLDLVVVNIVLRPFMISAFVSKVHGPVFIWILPAARKGK